MANGTFRVIEADPGELSSRVVEEIVSSLESEA
jgi:hypothetical protein